MLNPKASGNRILGFQGNVLRVRVAAPPERGKANEALVDLLSAALGVPKGKVRILKGHTSRDKWISVADLSLNDLHFRLKALDAADEF